MVEATAQTDIRKVQMCMDLSRKETMEQLYRMYEKTLFYLAYDILNNKQQAEDTVHDVFVKTVPYLKQMYPGTAKTKALLLRLTRTTAIDKYRRNQRESKFFSMSKLLHREEGIDEIQRYLDTEEGWVFISEVFEMLKPDHREIIKLCCFYGLSVKEAAKRLGQNEAAVKKRYYRAREAVKKWMRERDL